MRVYVLIRCLSQDPTRDPGNTKYLTQSELNAGNWLGKRWKSGEDREGTGRPSGGEPGYQIATPAQLEASEEPREKGHQKTEPCNPQPGGDTATTDTAQERDFELSLLPLQSPSTL